MVACMVRGAPVASALILALNLAAPAQAAPVLMISVDGMKPEYVLKADEHQLKIPFLRSLMASGSYASGVRGVWPTVTYPSHTTLVTGVVPARHGIENNLEFDPKRTFGDSWYWYASQIKVPTLWSAAHAAHLSTASVGWPATVGNTDIDNLIPEYWRIFRPTADLNPSDVRLIEALSRPAGMLHRLEQSLGPFISGNDPYPPGDAIKTRFALEILRTAKPAFMTVHLSALDEEEHGHGPFSPQANAELEVLDQSMATLAAAARANDTHTVVVVVSDHGFTRIERKVNLLPAFVKAHLVTVNESRIVDWKAEPWAAGGMAAVMLNAGDEPLKLKVRALLDELEADPANGIEAILDRSAMQARGGFKEAAFVIVMKLGYYALADLSSPALAEVTGTPGTHGFSPDHPEMRASFFVAGTHIAKHRDLGIVEMTRIAPTVASILKVDPPNDGAAALPVFETR